MGKSLFWKILVGCFLAITGLFTVLASVVITVIKPVQDRLIYTVSALAAAGCFLVVIGMIRSSGAKKRAAAAGAGTPQENADTANPLAFFGQAQFWGTVMLTASLPVFFLCRGYMRCRPEPAPVARQTPVAAPEVKFPNLQLQGVVCNGAKSTAVLDGRTVQLGESIEGVRVVAIEPESITVELAGATRQLRMD